MFMHSTSDFAHILFNMFTLFMFGVTLERVMGAPRFLFYYISCGIGAAIIQELVWACTWEDIFVRSMANFYGVDFPEMRQTISAAVSSGQELTFLNQLQTIGASGAIYGVLLAFGMLFPNMPLYIMFIPVPIKAKWMVIGYGAIELLIGLSSANDGVAHFAHLGGMIFGFIMIWFWKRKAHCMAVIELIRNRAPRWSALTWIIIACAAVFVIVRIAAATGASAAGGSMANTRQ